MNDSKYDDSDSDDDYKEVVVNSSDFRKEVYEFSSHRDLKVIKCIGQIESEFNYQVENEYKVSAVGTGTVYQVENEYKVSAVGTGTVYQVENEYKVSAVGTGT
eukprot:147136_1